ncbi:MAG: hypothetical protein KIS66_08970 [Fimbriimonadaceae bacterium]|nr:hypothetical protein [Fimbriimonadaceae bacterium]
MAFTLDLDRCPKCGKAWLPGAEFCAACAYIPIGAGLKAKKKKKRKVRPYREPGSSRGFLLFVLVTCLGYAAFANRVWEDGFRPVRELISGPIGRDVTGRWTVVKSVSNYAGNPDVLSGPEVEQLVVEFLSGNRIELRQIGTRLNRVASGHYRLDGKTVLVEDLVFDPADAGAPSALSLVCTWSGNDGLVVTVNSNETLYMSRTARANQTGTILRLGEQVQGFGEAVLREHGNQLRREMDD